MSRWISADVDSQLGRRAIVTGANTGLGYQTALGLARAGAEVVLAARSRSRSEAAAERITSLVPAARLRIGELDLADLASVRAFATREVAAGALDVLVNNAGVMLVPEREFTADGFEKHMGVNHLGHFALTCWLLPALAAAPAARVVSVGSIAHRFARSLDRTLNMTGGYRPMGAYAQSKLAVALFSQELHRRLRSVGSPVISLAAHPGWVATELFDRDDEPALFVRLSRWATQVLGSSPEAGARPQIHAAAAPEVRAGSYLGPRLLLRGGPHPARLSGAARDLEAAGWLWDRSVELTGSEAGLLAG